MRSSRSLNKWNTSEIVFQLEECGGGGDCLFHCLAVALTRLLVKEITMAQVRCRVADTLTATTLPLFLTAIYEDQDKKVPVRSPSLLETRRLVSTRGTTFQGTDTILRWLLQYDVLFQQLKLGFIILSSFGPGYTTILGENRAEFFILLFNHAGAHWQLVNMLDRDKVGFVAINRTALEILRPYL